VDDLIEGLLNLMNTDSKTTGPLNLGNPHELTIIQLAKLIIELTNSSSQIVQKNLPQDDPQKRKPDTSLAMKTIGWEPKVDIQVGLEKTIKYFMSIVR
jgi:UDP-glucuronate decarboxylase